MNKPINLLLGLVLSLNVAQSQATVFSFQFAGTFESDISDSNISAGDSFSASFDLDTMNPATTVHSNSTATHRTAISNAVFDFNGDSPVLDSVSFRGNVFVSETTKLAIFFDFDGASAPFNQPQDGRLGRFQLEYVGPGIFGSTADLTTLNVNALQPSILRQRVVAVYLGGAPSEFSRLLFSTATVSPAAPAQVPLPATLWLVAVAFAVLLGGRRCTRRRLLS